MLFGCIGRTKAELGRNFCPGGRRACLSNGILDQFQDLCLSGSKFGPVSRQNGKIIESTHMLWALE